MFDRLGLFHGQNIDHGTFSFLCSITEPWPRDGLLEPVGFRQFKVGQRLDAVDYQGKWYSATVVAVEPVTRRSESEDLQAGGEDDDDRSGPLPMIGTGQPGRVKVHFDNFAAKWDEWYDVDSTRLCPPGSVTGNKNTKLSPFRARPAKAS